MHRQPTPKAQAVIVREIFAAHGVTLAHRQGLDVVARLHGHANWNVMSAVATPEAAAPVVAAPVAAAPSRRTRSTVEGPLKCYSFDGIAYVETREEMEALDEISYRCTPELWASVEKQARALGFTNVGSIGVGEDEEQGDKDIKVFVNVELYGRCDLQENSSADEALADILDILSAPRCTDSNGNVLASPEDWEVLAIDSHDDVLPGNSRMYTFEAAGFAATRQQLDLLPLSAQCPPERWVQIQAELNLLGFTGVGTISLSEDDGQGDENIKVYVCVQLYGRGALQEGGMVPTALISILDTISMPIVCPPGCGTVIDAQAWELSAIGPQPDLMLFYP